MVRKYKSDIDVRALKERFAYDECTGEFKYRKTFRRMKKGADAGCVQQNGYVFIGIGGKKYSAHRLAWLYVYGELPDADIDHINRNRSDNRISNLRIASHAQNLANAPKRKHNRSGFKGVCKRGKKWRAKITVNKTIYRLGTYDTPEDASNAYNRAAGVLLGQFAQGV